MPHVGGQLQAQFMARIRGRDLQRCLVVPIDVGKSTAMALVADHYGEVVIQPFEFPLTEPEFASRTLGHRQLPAAPATATPFASRVHARGSRLFDLRPAISVDAAARWTDPTSGHGVLL